MRSFDEELLERVRSYRGTRPYEKALRKSKVWVEPMFGEAKQWHGMRRFRLRTLRRVNAEALLIATGQNIKRLLTFWGRGPRKLAQCQVLRPPAPTPSANSRLLQSSHRRRSTPLLARFSTGWGCSQKFEWLRRQEEGRGFARRLGLLFRGYSARARGALGTLEKPLLVLREGPLLGSHADQS
jgi:Transposase DDE domain